MIGDEKMTVREISDKVIELTGVPPLPLDETCDQLMVGSFDMEVTGIATTFMATIEVIKEAINQGINMIITHEPTWYTGHDETFWLKDDLIYHQKLALIEENNIAIWRFHDHMHMAEEDGILRGVIKELQWQDYIMPENKHCFQVPKMSVESLCEYLKEKLDIKMVRLVGKRKDVIERIGLFVGGFSLGFGTEQFPMEIIQNANLDVVICGDILEWTICPYIRDASELGMNKAMIVIGHERSEEAGMKHLVDWLQPSFKDTKIVFIDAKEPFDYL